MWSDAPLIACTVCLGAAGGPMLDAARFGVIAMAGFTTAMLVAFAVFFVRIARRTRDSSASAEP
jgi:hypothetical protein